MPGSVRPCSTHSERLDQAPAQVHATLLDEGTYLCAPRTMYRALGHGRRGEGAARPSPPPLRGAELLKPPGPTRLELGHHGSWAPPSGRISISTRYLQPLCRRLDRSSADSATLERALHRRDLREAGHSSDGQLTNAPQPMRSKPVALLDGELGDEATVAATSPTQRRFLRSPVQDLEVCAGDISRALRRPMAGRSGLLRRTTTPPSSVAS